MDRILPESGFINEKIRGHMPKRKDHRKRNKNPLHPSLWGRFLPKRQPVIAIGDHRLNGTL
jgi:hypothetical protein